MAQILEKRRDQEKILVEKLNEALDKVTLLSKKEQEK